MGNISLLESVWKKLDYFQLNSLNGRIIFQKSIYLLQEVGLNTNYQFSFYIYGPYSSELAKDGFQISNKQIIKGEESIDFSLVSSFKRFIEGKENNSFWFELVATTLFLERNNNKLNKEKIFEIVRKHQVYLDNKEEYELGWNKLCEFGLIKSIKI